MLTHATLADKGDVQTVFSENDSALRAMDYDTAHNEAHTFVANVDLPPSGVQDRSMRLMIRSAQGQQLIGILAVYLGHPTPNAAYIGDLFIRPKRHKQGLASEVVNAVESAALQAGLRSVFVNIGLKNWQAVEFWFNRGYRQMTRFEVSTGRSDETFAFIECQKTL